MQNISILGIGRLGLCNALSLERAGYNVIGVDIFPEYIDSINNKALKSFEPSVNDYLKSAKNFHATLSIDAALSHSDLIFICVQTPNGGGDKFYDHSILNALLMKINKLRPVGKHFVITCTVMPKYIDTVGKELMRDCRDCSLSYNPEFIAQGNIIWGYENPDMVLIGEGSKQAGDMIEAVYNRVCKNKPIICRMNPIDAEITKISINGFITTKIAYANMIGDACDSCGADKFAVMRAVGSDSRIGSKYILPGYSYGGPCFPRDTKALAQFIESIDGNAAIARATHELNEAHISNQARQLLAEERPYYIFTDVCYKPESKIPLVEESAKLKIAKLIATAGKKVYIHDEQQLVDETRKEYGNLFQYAVKQRLTIITTMKPMTATLPFAIEQTNAILSWTKLRIQPRIIVFGDDDGVPEFCAKHGLENVKDVAKNDKGVPLINDIIKKGYQYCDEYIMYINADILLIDDFSDTFEAFYITNPQIKTCLLTALRYDVKDFYLIDFANKRWREEVRERFKGEVAPATAGDLFLHKKDGYADMPDFAIAKYYFDSWMLDKAIKTFEMTVNMSETVRPYHHMGMWYQNNKVVERKEELLDQESLARNIKNYKNGLCIYNKIIHANYFTRMINGCIVVDKVNKYDYAKPIILNVYHGFNDKIHRFYLSRTAILDKDLEKKTMYFKETIIVNAEKQETMREYFVYYSYDNEFCKITDYRYLDQYWKYSFSFFAYDRQVDNTKRFNILTSGYPERYKFSFEDAGDGWHNYLSLYIPSIKN